MGLLLVERNVGIPDQVSCRYTVRTPERTHLQLTAHGQISRSSYARILLCPLEDRMNNKETDPSRSIGCINTPVLEYPTSYRREPSASLRRWRLSNHPDLFNNVSSRHDSWGLFIPRWGLLSTNHFCGADSWLSQLEPVQSCCMTQWCKRREKWKGFMIPSSQSSCTKRALSWLIVLLPTESRQMLVSAPHSYSNCLLSHQQRLTAGISALVATLTYLRDLFSLGSAIFYSSLKHTRL